MKRLFAFLIAALALVTLVPQAASAKPGTLKGLYNARYCEIFTVTQPEPPNFSIDVYNTVGLNSCPAAKWSAVDYTQIKNDTGSIIAVPNGPRRWLIDTIAGGRAGQPVSLSGLEMRYVGVLSVPSLTATPYAEMKIGRTTTWVFNKGRIFNFLVSPKGKRYALQAFTTNVDKSLRAKNIPALAKNPAMALPSGWAFKSIKLKKQLRLPAPGVATILRDPLGGTYQRFKWPKGFFKPVKKRG